MTLMQIGLIASAVSAGVASGMAYVFSTGVIHALNQLPQEEAVRSMQAINVAVINPLFLGVFMGTGLFAMVLAATHLMNPGDALNPWLLSGAVVYLVGMVFVTIGGNVPLNDALAALDANMLTTNAWINYARPWLAWNHLRTAAGMIASILFVLAAMR